MGAPTAGKLAVASNLAPGWEHANASFASVRGGLTDDVRRDAPARGANPSKSSQMRTFEMYNGNQGTPPRTPSAGIRASSRGALRPSTVAACNAPGYGLDSPRPATRQALRPSTAPVSSVPWHSSSPLEMPTVLRFDSWWFEVGQRSSVSIVYDTATCTCTVSMPPIACPGQGRTPATLRGVHTERCAMDGPWTLHVGARLNMLGRTVTLRRCADMATLNWLDRQADALLKEAHLLAAQLQKYRQVEPHAALRKPQRCEPWDLRTHEHVPRGGRINLAELRSHVQSLACALRSHQRDLPRLRSAALRGIDKLADGPVAWALPAAPERHDRRQRGYADTHKGSEGDTDASGTALARPPPVRADPTEVSERILKVALAASAAGLAKHGTEMERDGGLKKAATSKQPPGSAPSSAMRRSTNASGVLSFASTPGIHTPGGSSSSRAGSTRAVSMAGMGEPSSKAASIVGVGEQSSRAISYSGSAASAAAVAAAAPRHPVAGNSVSCSGSAAACGRTGGFSSTASRRASAAGPSAVVAAAAAVAASRSGGASVRVPDSASGSRCVLDTDTITGIAGGNVLFRGASRMAASTARSAAGGGSVSASQVALARERGIGVVDSDACHEEPGLMGDPLADTGAECVPDKVEERPAGGAGGIIAEDGCAAADSVGGEMDLDEARAPSSVAGKGVSVTELGCVGQPEVLCSEQEDAGEAGGGVDGDGNPEAARSKHGGGQQLPQAVVEHEAEQPTGARGSEHGAVEKQDAANRQQQGEELAGASDDRAQPAEGQPGAVGSEQEDVEEVDTPCGADGEQVEGEGVEEVDTPCGADGEQVEGEGVEEVDTPCGADGEQVVEEQAGTGGREMNGEPLGVYDGEGEFGQPADADGCEGQAAEHGSSAGGGEGDVCEEQADAVGGASEDEETFAAAASEGGVEEEP